MHARGRTRCTLLYLALAAPLALACSPEPPPATDAPTFEERLSAASEDPTVVERHDDGTLFVATTRISVPDDVPADPESRASWFLGEYGDGIGVEDPDADVEVTEILEGEHGTPEEGDALVTFARTVDGVPVFGGSIKVEVSGAGEITLLLASLPVDVLPPSTTPRVHEAGAVATALSELPGGAADGAELVIVNPALFGRHIDRAYLAWHIHVSRPGDSVAVFVDALDDGLVPYEYGLSHVSRNRMVYDAQHLGTEVDVLAMRNLLYDESGRVSAADDPEAAAVWQNLGDAWSWFWNTYGMDGYDRRGALIDAHVNYSTGSNNAHWSSTSQAFFFMDTQTSRDVSMHEYTHAVTEHSAGLNYVGESGALNESMSDVFAAFFDPADPWNYDNTRDLRDPTARGYWGVSQPRHMDLMPAFSDPTPPVAGCMTDADCCPSGHCGCVGTDGNCTSVPCTEFVCDPVDGVCLASAGLCNDYFGVHFNSGIPNHVAYLVTAGGTHADSGVQVRGVGMEKAKQIWFRALSWYMASGTSFQGAKIALRLAAWRFATREMFDITYGDCASVVDAWGAVGVGSADEDDDCWSDAVDNCPSIYNPDQDPAACECARISECGQCTETEGCGWCPADIGGACVEVVDGTTDACEAPQTDPMECGPSCAGEYGPCSGSGPDFDEECCDGLICVVGACVPAAGGRERASCLAETECAAGLVCRSVGSADAASTCCARDTDPCADSADCCGLAECVDGACVGRTSGQSCLPEDCAGVSYCDTGTCT